MNWSKCSAACFVMIAFTYFAAVRDLNRSANGYSQKAAKGICSEPTPGLVSMSTLLLRKFNWS